VFVPATLLKLWTKPKGPTRVAAAASATSTTIVSSVAGRSRKRSSARGASARRTSGRVRLQRATIATGQASPAKL
jgi:hypothetical protein